MLTADYNGQRSRPLPNVVGTCPFCGSEMIPRCGEKRVHHWAHKSKANCDPWWESETDWHRNWKNEFPLSWQEKIFKDRETGEKHIADIHTLAGLTIEVQHSKLEVQERRAREAFYGDMIWVVDGSRLVRDREKIIGWRKSLAEIVHHNNKTNLHLTQHSNEIFPADWLDCKVPVCFDYKGPKADASSVIEPLFLLYPGEVKKCRVVEPLTRESLLRAVFSERLHAGATREIMNKLSRLRLRSR